MIRVNLEPEPPEFETSVRQKGLSAIDEFVGRPPRKKRNGPKRKKIASSEKDIPSSEFPPFWRDALDDMLNAYDRRCAFLALYLEHATGAPSVDHMIPKSRRWDQVYEWNNYRLCAGSINTLKSDLVGLVDPMECRPGWFELELVGFQVVRGPAAPERMFTKIDATLAILNAGECCKAREEYVSAYEDEEIDRNYLERRAPFVALELERQGRL